MEENYWKRSRISRRRLTQMAGLAGVGAAGIALVGCGDDDDDSGGSTPAATSAATSSSTAAAGSPAASTIKRGGELLLSVGAPTSQTFDPHKTVNLGFTYYGIFLSRLISPHRQTVSPYQGELIQSWEQPDKTTFNFKVRPGVTWHDGKVGGGRALTAADVAFNIMRVAGKTDPTRQALYQRYTNLTGMDKAEAVDESTVKVTMTAPNSAFLAGLSDWRIWAITPEQVDKDPDFKDMKNLAGTGPFSIDSWDQTTLTGRYVANKKYWKKDQPYVDSVQQVSLQDPAAIQAAFLAGKIDYAGANSTELRTELVKRKGAKIVTWPNLLWDYYGFNQTRPVFSDPRVRQAIFKAVDYAGLMDQEYKTGFWEPTSVLLAGLPGAPSSADAGKSSPWNPATKQQDMTDAKALLSAAGFADGKGMSFKIMPTGNVGNYFNHAVRIQDQLTAFLPQAKLELVPPVDGAAFAKDLSAGNYDLVVYTAAPPPDAIFDPAQRLRTGGGRNYTKFSDAQIDGLIDNIFLEFDAAARAKLLDQLRVKMLDTILNVPLGKTTQAVAQQGRVSGFEGYGGVGSSLYSYDPINSTDQVWLNA